MIVRISSWDGKTMSTVKEQKVYMLNEIINEVKWMNENNIHGSFDLICESESDKMFLELLNRQSLI